MINGIDLCDKKTVKKRISGKDDNNTENVVTKNVKNSINKNRKSKKEKEEIQPGPIKILTNNARLIGVILLSMYFLYLLKNEGFMKTLGWIDADSEEVTDTAEVKRESVDEINDSSQYNYYLATVDQHIDDVSLFEVNCSKTGYWREKQFGTVPGRCGLLVTDNVVTKSEVKQLKKIAKKIIENFADSSTKVRESLNLQWINFHNIFRRADNIMSGKIFELIKKVGEICRLIIAESFDIDPEKLFYMNVTQITRYTSVTKFNEFRHVDKARSTGILVTSILWLSTTGEEFEGGETEFLIGGPEPYTPVLIDPKKGRFAAWTSSYENPHGVLEVKSGERYALIFGYTGLPHAGHRTLDDLRTWSLDPKNLPKSNTKNYYFVQY